MTYRKVATAPASSHGCNLRQHLRPCTVPAQGAAGQRCMSHPGKHHALLNLRTCCLSVCLFACLRLRCLCWLLPLRAGWSGWVRLLTCETGDSSQGRSLSSSRPVCWHNSRQQLDQSVGGMRGQMVCGVLFVNTESHGLHVLYVKGICEIYGGCTCIAHVAFGCRIQELRCNILQCVWFCALGYS